MGQNPSGRSRCHSHTRARSRMPKRKLNKSFFYFHFFSLLVRCAKFLRGPKLCCCVASLLLFGGKNVSTCPTMWPVRPMVLVDAFWRAPNFLARKNRGKFQEFQAKIAKKLGFFFWKLLESERRNLKKAFNLEKLKEN